MPLTGGEIRLDRSHDGKVANLTLSHGRPSLDGRIVVPLASGSE